MSAKVPRMPQDLAVLQHASAVGEQLLCPRPQLTASPPAYPSAPVPAAPCSKLTASLQSQRQQNHQVFELESILQANPPEYPTTFLGVSPPVRSSGACNPICHDASWTASAYSASHTNLQALRELDSAGVSFLRRVGDYRLVLGSPDPRAWDTLGLIDEARDVVQQQQQASSRDVRAFQLSKEHKEAPVFAPFSCRAQYFAVR